MDDRWKATTRLRLDYGLRFDYLTPQWDASKQDSNFLPDAYDKSQAVRLFAPAMIDGQRVGYDAVTGQTVAAGFIGRVACMRRGRHSQPCAARPLDEEYRAKV